MTKFGLLNNSSAYTKCLYMDATYLISGIPMFYYLIQYVLSLFGKKHTLGLH